MKPAVFPAGTLSRLEDGAISQYEASGSSRQPGDENGYDVRSMTDRYTRTPGSSITPLLAGAALVLAGLWCGYDALTARTWSRTVCSDSPSSVATRAAKQAKEELARAGICARVHCV